MLSKIFGRYSIYIAIPIIAYCFYNDYYDFMYKVLGIILALASITFLMMILGNLKLSKQLFQKRFFWIQPFLLLTALFIYGGIRFLTVNQHKSFQFLIILGIIGLVGGLIWAFRSYFKIPKKYRNTTLAENLDKTNSELDTENEGLLILDKNEISFIQEEKIILKFYKSNIKKVVVEVENKFFPIYFMVELHDGTIHYFDSDFPYVWQRELLN